MVFSCVECVELLKTLLNNVETCIVHYELQAQHIFCATFHLLIVCSQIIKKIYVYRFPEKMYNIYRGNANGKPKGERSFLL